MNDYTVKTIRLYNDMRHDFLPYDDIALHINNAGQWIPCMTDADISFYSWNVYQQLRIVWMTRVKTKKVTYESKEFAEHADERLKKMAYDIVTGQWHVSGYFPFMTHHPDRQINAPYYADRIVEQWLIERYFEPVLTPVIYKYNMACQKGKGPDLARQYMIDTLHECYAMWGNDFYICQFDCRKYFDNISHEKAYGMFCRYGICDFAMQLYKKILDSFHETADMEECYAARNHADSADVFGMPKGNLPSQWTGIMLLNELDWLLSEYDRCYKNFRYMDDGSNFCHTRADARRIRDFADEYLVNTDVGVMLHPKKTQIYPISRGITFCGWRYTMDENGIITVKEKQTKKHEQFHKLNKVWDAYNKGNVDDEKARQIRNGVIQYAGRGSVGCGLTHKMLQRYELYDGEYNDRYSGKLNPLGIKNIQWSSADPYIQERSEMADYAMKTFGMTLV